MYRAFDLHRRGYLSFREILLGLAAMEPHTQHGGTPAEMRCRYIFRQYDKNSDGLLDYSEFRSVIQSLFSSLSFFLSLFLSLSLPLSL